MKKYVKDQHFEAVLIHTIVFFSRKVSKKYVEICARVKNGLSLKTGEHACLC